MDLFRFYGNKSWLVIGGTETRRHPQTPMLEADWPSSKLKAATTAYALHVEYYNKRGLHAIDI